MFVHRYVDRRDGGRVLAKHLEHLRGPKTLVLGLPRGGLPVAEEVARALGAQLDAWIVRKVGAPFQPELGLGAVAEGRDEPYLDHLTIAEVGLEPADLEPIVRRERAEVEKRVRRFRRGGPPPDVAGRVVIVVDDGIATGGTARAALRALRARGPQTLVLAAPVAAADTLKSLRHEADEIVCPRPEAYFAAVGLWYVDFAQVEDDEVLEILDRARGRGEARPSAPSFA